MKFHIKLAVITGALALSAAPAMAAGPPSGTPGGPPSTVPENPGSGHIPSNPGPKAGLPAKAKAYGVYCQDQSKKPVEGQSGTPFSRCVTAMAKLASGQTDNPRTACKGESKKRVEGKKGTPFSRCVSSAAKLLEDLSEQEIE